MKMKVNLHITDRPIDTWAMEYAIIPRVGDRVLHPHSDKILLKVESVLLHRVEFEPKRPYPVADIYCSVTEV